MVDESAVSPCPTSLILNDFATGSLDADGTQPVIDHLRICKTCQTAVDQLRADESLARDLREALDLEQQANIRRTLRERLAGEFEVFEPLGCGGQGVVFEARDLKLGRRVAMKCLHAGQGMDARRLSEKALQEARQIAAAHHPNIASVWTVSDRGDLPFIVMELVEGVPITEACADQPLARQLEIFTQVLQAVAELHRLGLVHRDLKPANILVDRRGQVKLVDFGIAHSAESGAMRRGEGTPAYMAPEQCQGGDSGAAADVFSLGVTLFELLTGQRPFQGKGVSQIIKAVRHSNPPLPRSLCPEIPGALQAICLMALEKDPALRYPSARQFLLDIQRFINGEAIVASPTLLASVLEDGIERHVTDLQRWRGDRMISAREFDYFADKYARLRVREEFWVLDSRRFSFSQIMLHLGAWSCVLSVALVFIFPVTGFGLPRPVLPIVVCMGLLAAGLVLWRMRTRRVAIVMFMAACISTPFTVATTVVHYELFPGGGPPITWISNHQLVACFACTFLLASFLWWLTKTSALALVWGVSTLLLATALFSLADIVHLLQDQRGDIVAGRYLWPGAFLFCLAYYFDLRRARPEFANPLYVMGLLTILLALTLVAIFGPTPQWLGLLHIERADTIQWSRFVKYSFMLNGLLFAVGGFLAEGSRGSFTLRRLGTLLLWLVPTHILVPVFNLREEWHIAGSQWTYPELVLPLLALGFIFASVPKQMKSFFFSGLAYTALAAGELTHKHFQDTFAWPLSLAAGGFILALIAWRYPAIFDRKPALKRSR